MKEKLTQLLQEGKDRIAAVRSEAELQEVKALLRRLKRDNPNIENSIFRSIHAVALDTMPGYKSEGVEHSFLERFNAMEAASDENE